MINDSPGTSKSEMAELVIDTYCPTLKSSWFLMRIVDAHYTGIMHHSL